MARRHIEPGSFEGAYREVRGAVGVAWRVLGWTTEPDEDTEWTGYEVRTGRVSAIMVGDDRVHQFDPADLEPIDDDAYCHECGQIGCSHDGRAREDEDV